MAVKIEMSGFDIRTFVLIVNFRVRIQIHVHRNPPDGRR